ncbi:protein kinase domain-containing protein [Streptomyces turgidiscabies]|uniref:Serine/threonine protein kinase n=1 Tax=Streptomyces turgidiscabies TaxID=85558 RepID=A0ABU0RNC5_9ACTN|nr:protein kinase [Streptomyces turgidiscabies]MDQ0933499.1 serine/threonine protein kinase [Streptomyces turgidiscabies]
MDKLRDGDPVWIGAYRLVARLGAGGMGHVYVARSERGRTVAVKLVRRELAEQDEFRDRFRREVAAARRVGGRWTAPVLDADTEADVPWLATGYVAGPSLRQVVGHDHGPLPERSVRILAAGLAHALQDIHAAGIVHRDLKPSNVLVTIDGPRVIDFGIARALETVAEGGLTRAGALIGSPGFMAPEQVRGDRITAAADVFCLGSVLAYAATGALPFAGGGSGAHAMMFRIAQEEPDLRGVPDGMADLVRACLHKDPARRLTPEQILERTGASAHAVAAGYERDTWLPGSLVAQLGRHAVELLEAEADEGAPGKGHTAVLEEERGGVDTPDDVPTQHAPPTAPPLQPAHGHPPHHAQPFASTPGDSQRTPVWPGDPTLEEPAIPPAWSTTPPGTHAPHPGRHAEPVRRSKRSRLSMALGATALVVVLSAGASIYALLNDDGDDTPDPSPSRTATSPSRSASPPPARVPSGFVGSWTASIDNSSGHNTRQLTITRGKVGDQVLTLVADGLTDTGVYHCEFVAALTERPTKGTRLTIGPTQVTSGEPASACTPGAASTLTLLGDGKLRRATTGGDGQLTYEKDS